MENVKEKPKLNELFDAMVDYFTKVEKKTMHNVIRGITPKSKLFEEAADYLREKGALNEEIVVILQKFDRYVFGYHILDSLIDDEEISDIKILGYNKVRIKRNGKRRASGVSFKNNEDVNRFVENVAIKNKVSLSDLNALQNFTDKNTNEKFILRISITTPFINSTDNYYMHIRKTAKQKKDLERLIQDGMLDEETAKYLKEKAENSSGILFTGKGASGKTTLMNALLECIPEDKSGLVIQENEELFSNTHPDMMFQHVVEPRGESKIKYSLKDLAKGGLVMDIDYFVIGEIKGEEALYFLNAAYTGHRCWASVHGINSTEAMNKLADYAKYASDYSRSDLLRMFKSLSVVVFMEDYQVKEISEIVDFDEKTQSLVYKRILYGGQLCRVS